MGYYKMQTKEIIPIFTKDDFLNYPKGFIEQHEILNRLFKENLIISNDNVYIKCSNNTYKNISLTTKATTEKIFFSQIYKSITYSLKKIYDENKITYCDIQMNKKTSSMLKLNSLINMSSGLHLLFTNDNIIFDNDMTGLNFLNGRLDITTGEFTQERKEGTYITQITLLNYEYKEPTDLHIKYIKKVLKSFFGAELLPYISDIMGRILLGKSLTTIQKNFVFYGKGGNGKNTFFDIIREVLPYTVQELENAILTADNDSTRQNKIMNQIKPYHKFLIIDEQDSKKINQSIFKKLANNELVVSRLFIDGQHCIRLNGTIFILTNHQTLKIDIDKGVDRRLEVVHLNNEFVNKYDEHRVDNEKVFLKDVNLLKNFKNPVIKCAFIKYILQYTLNASKNPHLPAVPKQIENNTKEFIKGNDSFAEFIEAKLTKTESQYDTIPKEALLNEFKQFNKEYEKIGLTKFLNEMKSRDLKYDSKTFCNKDQQIKYNIERKQGLYTHIKFTDEEDKNDINNFDDSEYGINEEKLNKLRTENAKKDEEIKRLKKELEKYKLNIPDFEPKIKEQKEEQKEEPETKPKKNLQDDFNDYVFDDFEPEIKEQKEEQKEEPETKPKKNLQDDFNDYVFDDFEPEIKEPKEEQKEEITDEEINEVLNKIMTEEEINDVLKEEEEELNEKEINNIKSVEYEMKKQALEPFKGIESLFN